jgi:hypothetical protein
MILYLRSTLDACTPSNYLREEFGTREEESEGSEDRRRQRRREGGEGKGRGGKK